MPRRKARPVEEQGSGRPSTSSELTLEVTALLASIDNLTEFWPKATDGRPVPLGHSSMPPEVAERISQALSSISGSVAKAAAVLEQTAQGLGPEADVDTTRREAYAKLLSATSLRRSRAFSPGPCGEPVETASLFFLGRLRPKSRLLLWALPMGQSCGDGSQSKERSRFGTRYESSGLKPSWWVIHRWTGWACPTRSTTCARTASGRLACCAAARRDRHRARQLVSRRLYVDVSIDDLIGAIGWDPRSRQERESSAKSCLAVDRPLRRDEGDRPQAR